MLGSFGSQLGALQLGAVPQGAAEGITGTGSVTFGPPLIAAVGSVPELSVIGPVGPPRLMPRPIHGHGTVRVKRPLIAARGQQIQGRARVTAPVPAIAARAGLAFVGSGMVRSLKSVAVVQAAVTNRGLASLTVVRAALGATGTVSEVVPVRAERPRLRSLPEAQTVRVRTRRAPVRRVSEVQPDALDAAWQRLQQEQDEAEALMLLGHAE